MDTHSSINHPGVIGLPVGLVNANLDDEIMMRIGIPHRGGGLTAHAINEDIPVMVSAAAYWNPKKSDLSVRFAETNLHLANVALDSAGFTAMQQWKKKGVQRGMAGIYPWTCAQYVDLVCNLHPAWWAQPDACCEPEIASSEEEVQWRIRVTTTLLHATLRQVYHHSLALAAEGWTPRMIANELHPPIPVLQGWRVDHYQQSLEAMLEVWQRWTPWLAMPVLIGVGSVCRRQLHHREHGLYAILRGLEPYLPAGSRLHLFGVKGAALPRLAECPRVASADSMAWDDAARRSALKRGISNTISHRVDHMQAWIKTQVRGRLAPAGGSQMLLI